MNEKLKKNRVCLIVFIVLLIWGIGATGIGIHFYNKYKNIQSVVDAAGGSELVELVEQQRNTIDELQNDLNAVRGELESAVESAGELRDRNGRAFIIVERTDDRLTEFENSVDDVTDIIERIERRQQRIDELVIGIREDNRAIRMELTLRP